MLKSIRNSVVFAFICGFVVGFASAFRRTESREERRARAEQFVHDELETHR